MANLDDLIHTARQRYPGEMATASNISSPLAHDANTPMTSTRKPPRARFWFLWRMPIILAALTIFGLLAALLGTGVWHWLSWLTLATVPAVSARYGLMRSAS